MLVGQVSIELGRNRRRSVNTIKLVFQIGYFIERKSFSPLSPFPSLSLFLTHTHSVDPTLLFDVACWFIITKSSYRLEYIYISTSTADKINYFAREHVMAASFAIGLTGRQSTDRRKGRHADSATVSVHFLFEVL